MWVSVWVAAVAEEAAYWSSLIDIPGKSAPGSTHAVLAMAPTQGLALPLILALGCLS